MRSRVWDEFSDEEKAEYIKFLKIFGSLSGLFKEITNGVHADKPYLYYRNHEKLFARVFNVEDLTRQDSAFDAIASLKEHRVGIGLKTWIHSRDLTYQKVAEFNKATPEEIQPLLEEGDTNQIIKKIAELRNMRINLDKRQYNTDSDVYHYVTRSSSQMNILETKYDLIQEDSLKLISETNSSYTFTDGLKNYRFYPSKSVLMEEFSAKKEDILTAIPIKLYTDPFNLLEMIDIHNESKTEVEKDFIYLPLYSDRSGKVEEKSGFNAWNGASKSKGSNILRPNYEAYIGIPTWVHHFQNNFFGFNALDKQERDNSPSFNLHLPNQEVIQAIITQENGKSLQTNPQSILGKWILRDVLGLQARELLTYRHLQKLGVDSLKITKKDNENYKIELAEMNAFEKWKQENENEIRRLSLEKGFRMPQIRIEN